MTNIQLFVVLTSLLGIGIWSIYTYKTKKWLVAVAPITYFLHIILFNIIAEMGHLTPIQLNNWSQAIRLHSEYIFIVMALVLINKETSQWI